ncbi:hypothetical protein [Paenibacillus segetis]|uniref:DUF6199 domain-containing protein n=1 Tax=Paenibacillus segetis TaxID=1325360 RepID=A0ABQ1YG47_9BACL|nr:hypothetical protein [Paenibacillus segetis]GGH23504.1 hypothetical protein GCM10008013_22660 [Paenibacillus segetis]
MILIGFIIVMANTYFSKSVFFINQHKYKQVSSQNNTISYRSGSVDAPTIDVHINDQNRKILINNEAYFIYNAKGMGVNKYSVTYPNGHKYEVVVNQSQFFMSYDEHGEYVSEISFYVNGQRIIQEGEEEYLPSALVIAAYSEHHTKQGSLALFILSWLLLIYGWCGFRYEKFQKFLFLISLRWIWTNDHEPSDFYYFMSKVGGVLVMIGSIVLAIKSFFIY